MGNEEEMEQVCRSQQARLV